MISKRFLQSTLDALSAHIAILDEKGGILEVNGAWKQFSEENFPADRRPGVGTNYLEICDRAGGLSSEDASAAACGIRAVATGQSDEFHLEYPCHSPQERRWFALRATRFAGDGPARVVLAHENITARKLAEEHLQANEHRLQLALEAGGLDAFEYTVSDRRFWCFPRGDGFSGLPLQTSVSYEEWLERIHAEDRSRVAAGLERMLNEQIGFDLEYRRLLPNGEVQWVHTMASPIAEQGKVRRAHGVRRDITAYKESVAGLNKLSRAVEQSPVSIVITDRQGRIEYVNPKFCAVTGYTPGEVRGENPRMLKSGEMSADSYRQMWATLTAGEEWRGEFHNRKKNGELYWESASISPLRDDSGNVTHFIAVKEDITERKRAARQLIEYRENAERSRRALAHEQELNQIKSRFVSMVSHEFRTPLCVISMAVSLLDAYLDKMSGPDRTANVRQIQRAVGHMTQMMEDLLVHEKLGAGKMEGQRSRVDLAELLRRLIPAVSNHPVSIGWSVDPSVREVWLDENLLVHILSNLLGNAVKYSTERERITLEAKRLTANPPPAVDLATRRDDRLELKISDSGIGIPAADLPGLFKTFQRATNVGNRPGTGMGLAIVKQCVDALGGAIHIESEEGVGTTVWVWLPLVSADPPAVLPLLTGGMVVNEHPGLKTGNPVN